MSTSTPTAVEHTQEVERDLLDLPWDVLVGDALLPVHWQTVAREGIRGVGLDRGGLNSLVHVDDELDEEGGTPAVNEDVDNNDMLFIIFLVEMENVREDGQQRLGGVRVQILHQLVEVVFLQNDIHQQCYLWLNSNNTVGGYAKVEELVQEEHHIHIAHLVDALAQMAHGGILHYCRLVR